MEISGQLTHRDGICLTLRIKMINGLRFNHRVDVYCPQIRYTTSIQSVYWTNFYRGLRGVLLLLRIRAVVIDDTIIDNETGEQGKPKGKLDEFGGTPKRTAGKKRAQAQTTTSETEDVAAPTVETIWRTSPMCPRSKAWITSFQPFWVHCVGWRHEWIIFYALT
jgi:hypothetical protein